MQIFLTKMSGFFFLFFCLLLIGCGAGGDGYPLSEEESNKENKQEEIYQEFLNGEREAENISIEDIVMVTGEPDKHYFSQYTLFDSTGDGLPELHVKSTRYYYIFTCEDNELRIWASLAPTTTLWNDGTFLEENTSHVGYEAYYSFSLDKNGDELLGVYFSKTDTGYYEFAQEEVTKEEWEELTEPYLYKKKEAVEWITLFDESESEKEDTDSGKRYYPERGTIPIYDGEGYGGTVEEKYMEHEEIRQEPMTKEGLSYSVYKISAGTVPNFLGEETDTIFWIPQITGMEDKEKEERLNQLLLQESQEWRYFDWGGQKNALYIEYYSDKYLSYCYYMYDLPVMRGYYGTEMEIYITIDLEEEKRVKLDDLIDWNNETFKKGFVELCLNSGTEYNEKQYQRGVGFLESANETLLERREKEILNGDSPSIFYLYNKHSFYLRPGKVIVEFHPAHSLSDVTIELAVFEEFLKVEPWY